MVLGWWSSLQERVSCCHIPQDINQWTKINILMSFLHKKKTVVLSSHIFKLDSILVIKLPSESNTRSCCLNMISLYLENPQICPPYSRGWDTWQNHLSQQEDLFVELHHLSAQQVCWQVALVSPRMTKHECISLDDD